MAAYDLVVIGAGPGGYEAALEAAKLGLKTAVVEKDAVGGTCLNRGCIPTKTLLHSAKLYAQAKNAAPFGVAAQDVTVDMHVAQQHKKDTVETLQKGILSLFKTRKVALLKGEGKVLSPNQVEVTSENGERTQLETKKILLACGSVPSHPPIPGADLPGIMTSDELLSYDGEPFSSLLIIGGGVIGIEFAGIYAALGTKVIILEALPSLLANMDRELGNSVKLSLKKKGADIHTGAKVEKIEKREDGFVCTFTQKDEGNQAAAQAVLIAVGRRPYTTGLFGEGMTPSMERGKIQVNESYETSIPGIYAIGDVIGQIQLAHAATAQGKRAVRTIAKKLGVLKIQEKEEKPLLIPACVYTSPEIASVGLTLDEAKAQGLLAASHKILSSSNGKSVLSMQERGFMKVVYLEESHVIIGAQLLCARATDMISEFALAIQNEMTLEEMEEVVRPHPSFSEMITDAVTL